MKWYALLQIGLFLVQNPSLESTIISFEITHMGVLTVEGQFDEVRGVITKTSEDQWLVKGEINVRSIDTDNRSRDETLLTEQYLNVEAFPVIPFVAQLSRDGAQFGISVDLKIRGLELQLNGNLLIQDGKLSSERLTFKRSDIDLDFGLMDSLIGDQVTIVIDSGIELSTLD